MFNIWILHHYHISANIWVIIIKLQLMENKYDAPIIYLRFPAAIEYPTVQTGGIRAVAIATPGTMLLASFFRAPIIPAKPPTNAITTSQIVGEVLVIISVLA